jgi:hypothetical protein
VASSIGLAALGALVPEACVVGAASWARVFGSGASLTHLPENRQQMDLIKLIDCYSAHTGCSSAVGSGTQAPDFSTIMNWEKMGPRLARRSPVGFRSASFASWAYTPRSRLPVTHISPRHGDKTTDE